MNKLTKVMTSAALLVAILSLTGCGMSDTNASTPQDVKTKVKEQKSPLQDPKHVADRYLSYIYDAKTAEIQDITGESSSEFKEEQKDFFSERAGAVTPIEYPLVIEYEGFSELYTPEKIKDEYATAMVNYFEQIDNYSIKNVEESENGAEITVETEGLAMNALANQANAYMDSLRRTSDFERKICKLC
ncbi:hypothetical protein [Listeria seeligeri]|uniref:hypothetical protein n=1 Tax=Listeria seeligeri TaxID=1640 RepID=UPI001623BD2B|nr:hypothetical protein [Listeria seeligeri]MBF2626109.1 hypothetical protein [Listeria seeligeri]MBF2673497.1 hypothetical protein [Listeria seeligeri]